MTKFDELASPTELRLIIALADIAGFAQMCQVLSDRAVFDMLDHFYELVGTTTERAGGAVVKFMGDAALVVFPEEMAGQAVETLRQLKTEVEAWLPRFDPAARLYVKAHIGTVTGGPLGTAREKRFDVIGDPVMKLFTMPTGEFELSAELEQALAVSS